MPRKNPQRRIPHTAGAILVPSKNGRGFKPFEPSPEYSKQIGISATLQPTERLTRATNILGRGLGMSGFDVRIIRIPAIRVIGMYDARGTIIDRADKAKENDERSGWREVKSMSEYDSSEARSLVSDVRNQWVSATRPRKNQRVQFSIGAIIPRLERLPFSGDDAMMVGPRIGAADSDPDIDYSLADAMSLMAEVTGNERLMQSAEIQRPMLPLIRVMGDASGIDEAIASIQKEGDLTMSRHTSFELSISTRVVTLGQ